MVRLGLNLGSATEQKAKQQCKGQDQVMEDFVDGRVSFFHGFRKIKGFPLAVGKREYSWT